MNSTITMVAGLVLSGFGAIFALYPYCRGENHWQNTGPALVGMFFLGCSLDIMGLKFTQNCAWMATYMMLLFMGKWVIRAGAEEYLRVHAWEQVRPR